ncbi:unnamed protein product [Timema podura]|uniref:Uncharacterized protein n=1 Tax=Timema podura TaxID=61482 RepID=A0ABN7NKZ2_TIMPD|nr:unnamed protein product [Timema podura]
MLIAVVRLNLRADHFCPGKKNYERVRWCLSHGPQLTFNLLIVWEPPVCHPKFLQRHDYNVSVPVISPTDERECCTPSELIEWLGAYSVGADLQSGEPDNFVNTYQPPVESILLGKVVYLQWTGFFTYLRIQKLFAAIRQPPLPIGFGDVFGADEVSVGCSKSSACGDPSPKGRLSNHSGSRYIYASERRWD